LDVYPDRPPNLIDYPCPRAYAFQKFHQQSVTRNVSQRTRQQKTEKTGRNIASFVELIIRYVNDAYV